MNSGMRWTRRTFLANASLASAAVVASFSPYAAAMDTEESTARPLLACIASNSTRHALPHQLEAFVVHGREKHLLAKLRSAEPFGAVALHPSRNVVYAAYATQEYLGLPGASIAAFAIDEASRSFVQLSRRALTLSATHPRHVSISPDGNTVLVSASGGGAYNTFRADTDGSLLGSPHVLKLAGCGPHPLQHSAQPVFSAFHHSSRYAYACDFGSDRIDQISFVDDAPSIESRASLVPGSGPCHVAIHPSEHYIAVVSNLRPLVTIIEINPHSGRLGKASQRLFLDAATLSHGYFRASGCEFCVSGRAESGEAAIFILEVDQPSLRVRQTVTEQDYPRLLRANDDFALLAGAGATMAFREL
jgi:6-phosphogluconolactonase (cycloisomerase 2 family)